LEKFRLINFIRKQFKIFQNIYEFLAGSGTNMEKEKVKKTTLIGCVVRNAPLGSTHHPSSANIDKASTRHKERKGRW
jgi:hypothetical protein